nr:GNAT family N-acetyltransferase [uncultured Allomuricauda sp.]
MENGLKVSRLHKNDVNLFIQLIGLLNEVFEEYHTVGSKKQLEKLLNKPEFYAVAAFMNGSIIGGLTAYELECYYNDKSELYIYDIAVKPEFQNQGVGKRLINYLKECALKKGIETIFVDAYSEDKQAVKFYESTMGKGEKVRHFNFEIKTTNNKH